VALRGHPAPSACSATTLSVITADSLFPGGPGKTNSPEDFRSLLDDLETRVFGTLPDEAWVYPGHGDDTTLGKERPSLPEWRARGW
jgi:glyoxylase-like metal-dependent hydrolase (beta-lactamase superfamily II)